MLSHSSERLARRSRAGARRAPAAPPGPRPKERDAPLTGPERRGGSGDSNRSTSTMARSPRSRNASSTRRTATARQARQGAAHLQEAEQRTAGLGRRQRQHVEIGAEQQQHGDEVHQALEDDRGERARRSGWRGAGPPGTAARPRPREGPRSPVMNPTMVAEKRSDEGDARERGQQVAPPPGPDQVGQDGDQDHAEQEARVGGPESRDQARTSRRRGRTAPGGPRPGARPPRAATVAAEVIGSILAKSSRS